MKREMHLGHAQLDVLDSLRSIAPAREREVVTHTGLSHRRVQAVVRRLLERGLISRRRNLLCLSYDGERALSRAIKAGREPGVPYSGPRKYPEGA